MKAETIKAVMGREEAHAAQVVLKAVIDRRILIEHDEGLTRGALEALATAEAAPQGGNGRRRRTPARTSNRGRILTFVVQTGELGATLSTVRRAVPEVEGPWKRLSELAAEGWIERTKDRRDGQMVYIGSQAGREWVEAGR